MTEIRIPIDLDLGLTLVITDYSFTPRRRTWDCDDPADMEVLECHLENYRDRRLHMDATDYLDLKGIEDDIWTAVEEHFEESRAEHEAGLADHQYEHEKDRRNGL